MSTQPEALRLADALGNLEATGHCSDSVSLTDRSEAIADAAAAELRRLHAVEADFHMAYRMKCDEQTKVLHAQRDALLEALKEAAEALEIAADNAGNFYQYTKEARAAIKMAEEGK